MNSSIIVAIALTSTLVFLVKIIELIEYKPSHIPRNDIPLSLVEVLRKKHKERVKIDLKDTQCGDMWQLTSQGWVGYIPLTPEFTIKLEPKVKIKNLFGMLEYDYNLQSFHFLNGLIDCDTLEEFYDRLAAILARRILDRCRQGLYRAYLPKTDRLAYIRGRLNVQQAIQKPWNVKLPCHYEEHTGDIEDNQILAWTLRCISRTGLCRESTRTLVRQCDRALQGFVTLKPFKPQDCVGRKYHRLNQDYQTLHALCRFFLAHTGPSHETGNNTMLPFLVDMAQLYELFVAEWLKENVPKCFSVKLQYPVIIDENRDPFRIDIILCDAATGETRYILDTKYKISDGVASDDLHQMRSYAAAIKCSQAVLIYPKHLKKVLDTKNNDIRVRSLTFSLDDDLQQAGESFLQNLTG